MVDIWNCYLGTYKTPGDYQTFYEKSLDDQIRVDLNEYWNGEHIPQGYNKSQDEIDKMASELINDLYKE